MEGGCMTDLNVPVHAREYEMRGKMLGLTSSQYNVVNEIIGLINPEIDRVDAASRGGSNLVTCQTRRLSQTVRDFVSDYYKLFGWSDVEWKGRTVYLRR
jgi:hypothetical protein